MLGAFYKEKAIVGAFSEHCEASRRFVDSSNRLLHIERADDSILSVRNDVLAVLLVAAQMVAQLFIYTEAA